MKALQEFVGKKDNIKKTLPSIHTTTFNNFLNIKEIKKLVPTPCNRFLGENLLYFFYGKAAYVPKGKNENTSAQDALPICFILKIQDSDIQKAFPFDTGAFLTDRYSNVFDSSYDISLFELSPTFKNINQYITTYFNNAINYLSGECTYVKRAALSELAHASFIRLLTNQSAVPYDDRCNTIELISKLEFELENNVLASIVPSQFLSDKDILEFLNSIGGELLTYIAATPHNYNTLIGKVRQEAERFLLTYLR